MSAITSSALIVSVATSRCYFARAAASVRLMLVSHREDLLPRVLADHLRMLLLDVLLGLLDQVVVGLAFDDLAAGTVDGLHGSLLELGRSRTHTQRRLSQPSRAPD